MLHSLQNENERSYHIELAPKQEPVIEDDYRKQKMLNQIYEEAKMIPKTNNQLHQGAPTNYVSQPPNVHATKLRNKSTSSK